tara:strand:+ start:1065 stop:1487 length:423 start_codon:yes stop_codon:yes gene_type:complete
MAITFENTIYDKIVESLVTLINGEFTAPVYYDQHKGNHSFLITPSNDELIGHLSDGIERQYTIEVQYQLKIGGQYNKNDFKQISNTMERFKRLIFNNMSYSSGDVWFDAGIENIGYERDADDDSLLRSIANFNCTNIEII